MRAPPRWPLAAVLALAARRERGARMDLADALAEAARRCGEEEAAREALEAHRAQPACAAGPGVAVRDAGALASAALHGARRVAEEARLAEAVRLGEAAHGAARDAAERRRTALGEARAAVRALEARRQSWREARARDRARVEEDAADDLVSARWGGAS